MKIKHLKAMISGIPEDTDIEFELYKPLKIKDTDNKEVFPLYPEYELLFHDMDYYNKRGGDEICKLRFVEEYYGE